MVEATITNKELIILNGLLILLIVMDVFLGRTHKIILNSLLN